MSSANSFRRNLALLLVIAGVAVAGAWRWWPEREPASGPVPRLNVLLVTVDTLRADAVGAYGQAGNPTPRIDRLAERGARFTTAYAHNVVTLPSHVNILSGQLPPGHGVRDNGGFRLPDGTETLATHLKRQGYRTAAFVSAFPLDSRFGLDAGFDLYDDQFAAGGARPAFFIQERPAAKTVARARQWIESAGPDPWFSWVHVYEPHYPYAPPGEFAARWPRDPYMGEVAAVDAALAPLLDPILAAAGDGHTLVVITSDHGEALGDHGEASHGIFAYEPVLRVPLVIYAPGRLRPRVVSSPAQHIDILPTLLDLLDLAPSADAAGRSLVPEMMGRATSPGAVLYFEALSASLNRGWAPLFGLVSEGFKYIDLPIPELYDLASDPREVQNLAASDPARVAALRSRLQPYRDAKAVQQAAPASAEARERLRGLGYVSGRAAPPAAGYTEADDPKRLMDLDAMLQQVLERYVAGDLPGALSIARQLVDRRPAMAVSWMQLAQLEREAGNAGAAVDAMRRAVTLSPGDAEPLALLGAYLTESGRARDAADLLAAAAGRPDADPDVLSTRALALARLRRFPEALATLTRARERDPSNAMLLVHAGTVELSSGNRQAARTSFTEAVRLDGGLARAHSSLGVLALEDGRVGQATEHWRAATAIDPREFGNVLSLGIALAQAGRPAEARACFAFFAAHAPVSQYRADLERVRAWLAGAR